jgi:hypothetical protein
MGPRKEEKKDISYKTKKKQPSDIVLIKKEREGPDRHSLCPSCQGPNLQSSSMLKMVVK